MSGYGLTEAPILTMGSVDDRDEDLAKTEGAPMPGVELKLVKLDGTVAGDGEEGEVRAKAPQLMLGYLDASLDADAFDEEGYFRTGDLGVAQRAQHADHHRRLKDIIIRKGENISAKEVEDHLFAHPKVLDVAVIGLPDPERGERVCAVVSDARGLRADRLRRDGRVPQGRGPDDAEDPRAARASSTSSPRNPTGKILKHELRKTYGG